MRQQLLLQRSASLNKQGLIDRLVRHLAVLVVRIRALETGRYRASQRTMPRQFTGLRHQANTQAWPRLV